MPLDPTLPRPDTSTLPESDLIARVKVESDSAALTAIVNLHSGLYFSVVNRYAAAYPNAIKARDMKDDQLFNIYTFVQDYDPARGMKLSSYIGDRTDFLCKDMLKKDGRNPLSPQSYVSSGSAPLDVDDDVYATTAGGFVTLQDNTTSVTEIANRDLGSQDIRRVASEVCQDERFLTILDCRNESMSWREVGEKVGCSHEGARRIYTHNIALVKAKLSS